MVVQALRRVTLAAALGAAIVPLYLPTPAQAWWRGGCWRCGYGYGLRWGGYGWRGGYGPGFGLGFGLGAVTGPFLAPPVYALPPVIYAAPPVYYAPPVVTYPPYGW